MKPSVEGENSDVFGFKLIYMEISISVIQTSRLMCMDCFFSAASACVRMLDWFEHKGHICIVFELLGLSTFEFLRQNEFLPFSVEQIRHMAFQIFRAACCKLSVFVY